MAEKKYDLGILFCRVADKGENVMEAYCFKTFDQRMMERASVFTVRYHLC